MSLSRPLPLPPTGNTVRLYGERRVNGQKVGGAPLDLPKIRKNRLIEIIPINTGCLNQCTYCKTKHARGDLGSYPPHQVVERAKQAFQEGVVELWLTSEDLGAYGHDIGVTLPELLWQLVRVVPEGCMVRLGMTNPPYIMDHMTVGGDSTMQLYSVLYLGVCRRWRPYCVILTSIRSSTSLCSAAAILSSLK